MIEILIFGPLLGSLIAGFMYRSIGENVATILATSIVILGAIISWFVFLDIVSVDNGSVVVFDWIISGSLNSQWAVKVDSLVKVMLVVVLSVSSLVHLYSLGYMRHDHNWNSGEKYKARFFSYLSFFTFAMLVLVSSDNLLQLFFGWEGVGVASYLLIGFYFKKPTANNAAMKAFIVNRVGDFGFLIGIFLIFYHSGSINFLEIFSFFSDDNKIKLLGLKIEEVICFFLFIGAMGKSAQIFLHTWLPDAMEGPTPVSALIHAATMVTAGVFLTCRFSPLFEAAPQVSTLVLLVGVLTAFFAATTALVQNDIKRIIAYSTCSQLGYMFAAVGAGFYQAAMFHLFTHAFFKALLFLGAGSVIHAMHHEQDIRRFGGLRAKLPITFFTMTIGTLAITGVGIPLSYYVLGFNFGLSGFVSKDIIIEGVFASKNSYSFYAFVFLTFSALLTSFYSWRLVFLTFFGSFRGKIDDFNHCHEPERTMLIPLVLLSLGAVFFGSFFEFDFTSAKYQIFSDSILLSKENTILKDFHYVPVVVKLAPFLAMLIGLSIAIYFYLIKPSAPRVLANQQPILYKFFLNKWYFDELYNIMFVASAKKIGNFFWKVGDVKVINGSIHGIGLFVIPYLVALASRLQSGFVFHYALVMIIGFTAIMSFFIISFYGL